MSSYVRTPDQIIRPGRPWGGCCGDAASTAATRRPQGTHQPNRSTGTPGLERPIADARDRRVSRLWLASAAATALIAVAAWIVAARVQADATRPVGEGELFAHDTAMAAIEEGVPATPGEEKEQEDPPRSRLERMQSQLEKAITEEDYERAAQLRDEIARMKPD